MKKIVIPCLILLLCLTACSLQSEEEEPFSAAFTIRPKETLTEVYYEIPLSTDPGEISGTTLPDADHTLRLEDLRSLMTQSVFAGKADAVVHLWTEQIRYTLDGDFTDDDRNVLSGLAADLVQISAFPGMRETDAQNASVVVHFADADKAQFTYTLDADGAVTAGQITIPSSLPAWQRGALLEENMFRLFGFFYDAQTSLDSLLAEEPADAVTEADLILLETVYGQMQSGMTKDDAETAFTNHFLSN